VLHEAALGSVPRSIADPLETHRVNVDGFLQLFVAARDAGVSRVVYASSSSVYGDVPARSKAEGVVGEPLSPYALSKRVDELYAALFARVYGVESIGLRYFNVFGPRQDPEGPYAAVIPRWVASLRAGERCVLFGDGETSRDFCYVENVVQANLLAATVAAGSEAVNQVYNVGADAETTLDQLFVLLRDRLAGSDPSLRTARPEYQPFRVGDVRTSRADIGKARRLLGYAPAHSVASGLDEMLLRGRPAAARPLPARVPAGST
jgi:UDP-N-acetylglucosamine 4-epimerase